MSKVRWPSQPRVMGGIFISVFRIYKEIEFYGQMVFDFLIGNVSYDTKKKNIQLTAFLPMSVLALLTRCCIWIFLGTGDLARTLSVAIGIELVMPSNLYLNSFVCFLTLPTLANATFRSSPAQDHRKQLS
jgi:hypothetical protein